MLDLRGIHFSAPAPQAPPVTMAPHMVVLVRCAPDERGTGALEVRFLRDGEQVAGPQVVGEQREQVGRGAEPVAADDAAQAPVDRAPPAPPPELESGPGAVIRKALIAAGLMQP